MSVAEKLPFDVPDDRDLTPLFYSWSSQSAARDSLVRSGMGLLGPLAPVFDQELYVAGEDDLVVPAGDLYARTQATTRPKLLIFIIVPDYI